MADTTNPTARRLRLGILLRDARNKLGITPDHAAAYLGKTPSTVSRIERGRVGVQAGDLALLLQLYQITDRERVDYLTGLARQGRNLRGWWDEYRDAYPNWFESYAGFEAEATKLHVYQVALVPGLFQTSDYARAVIRAEHPDLPLDEIERRVGFRMARQAALDRTELDSLWVIIDEAVLVRRVGSPDVMRAQLKRLLEVEELPAVTLQIMPFAAGAHVAMGSPFAVLTLPDGPELGYLENSVAGLYVEKPGQVAGMLRKFDLLRATALGPPRSRELICSLLDGSRL